ncbi:unnamed protein product, partial [Effrenium voratum]
EEPAPVHPALRGRPNLPGLQHRRAAFGAAEAAAAAEGQGRRLLRRGEAAGALVPSPGRLGPAPRARQWQGPGARGAAFLVGCLAPPRAAAPEAVATGGEGGADPPLPPPPGLAPLCRLRAAKAPGLGFGGGGAGRPRGGAPQSGGGAGEPGLALAPAGGAGAVA